MAHAHVIFDQLGLTPHPTARGERYTEKIKAPKRVIDSNSNLKKFHNAKRTRMVPSNVNTVLNTQAGGKRVPTTSPTAASHVSESVNAVKMLLILVRRSVPIAV